MVRLALLSVLLWSCGAASANDYRWSLAPSLPVPVQEIYPTVSHGQIVVAGGLRAGKGNMLEIDDRVWMLTPGAAQWQPAPALPERRHHPLLVGTEKGVWSFGGFIESDNGQWTNTSTVMFLWQGSESWQLKEPMPVTLSETVSAHLSDGIHLAGGRSATKQKNGQWLDSKDTNWHGVLNPDTGIWSTAPVLPTPRNSACSAVLDGQWHVIGGRTVEGGNLAVHEVFSPQTRKWKTLAPLPKAQGGLTCAAYLGDIYVFGGEYFTEGGGVYRDVWRYSPRKRTWSSVSTMPVPRHGLGSVVLDNKIWLIGGAAKAGARDTKTTVSQFQRAESR